MHRLSVSLHLPHHLPFLSVFWTTPCYRQPYTSALRPLFCCVQIADFQAANTGCRVLLTCPASAVIGAPLTTLTQHAIDDYSASVYTHDLIALTRRRFLHPLSPCVAHVNSLEDSCLSPGVRSGSLDSPLSVHLASASFKRSSATPAHAAGSACALDEHIGALSLHDTQHQDSAGELADRNRSCSDDQRDLTHGMDHLPGAAPDTSGAELLLQVIAGRAPELMSPLQVLALAEAALFYMADPVLHMLPTLLQPMFDPAHYQALSGQEVRLFQSHPHHSLRWMCL